MMVDAAPPGASLLSKEQWQGKHNRPGMELYQCDYQGDCALEGLHSISL